MEVLCKSFYRINLEKESIEKAGINKDFDEFITSHIEFVANDKATRIYKIRSLTKEVINIMRSIICDFNTENILSENLDIQFENIANRLLKVEMDAQENIDKHNLNRTIRRGGLLISILKSDAALNNDDAAYTFILSKVNNEEFIDEYDLIKKAGFSSENQKIWKTAVFNCLVDDTGSVDIEEIRVYLDKQVKYWCDDFLEIDKMITDEYNTHTAFKNIEALLKKRLKTNAPNDYVQLSNSVIGYMRRGQLITYNNMIEDIFSDFVPSECEKEHYDKLIKDLFELPAKKKFDPQFIAVPSEIKTRIKKVYPVAEGIELKINDYIQDLKEKITSYQTEDGVRYLQIRTTDNETYRAFKQNR